MIVIEKFKLNFIKLLFRLPADDDNDKDMKINLVFETTCWWKWAQLQCQSTIIGDALYTFLNYIQIVNIDIRTWQQYLQYFSSISDKGNLAKFDSYKQGKLIKQGFCR